MVCLKCNASIEDGAIFCPNCGTKIEKRKPKKRTILLIVLGILLFLLILLFFLFKGKEQKNYSTTSSSSEISYTYRDGYLKFIDGRYSDTLVQSSEDALESLEAIKEKIGFQDIKKEFVLASTETNENITYYRFNQVYNGVPVLNQNSIISVNQNKEILSYSGFYIPNITLSTTPKKSKEEIEKILKNDLGENTKILSNELNIWADHQNQDLIYVVTCVTDTSALEIFMDANSGEILQKNSAFLYSNPYSYTGVGLDNQTYSIQLEEYFDLLGGIKNRYRFYDPTRKISVADYRYVGPIVGILASAVPGTTPITVNITDGQMETLPGNATFLKSAITAMGQYTTIYDYYKNVLNRISYDNKGSRIIINIGLTAQTFSSEDLNNAMWCALTHQMYIGDFNGKSLSASLDALAHEFTHGVIEFTADFASTPKKEDQDKAFETGALNEGIADIMGSLIEGKNWTIAENNVILRDASNPLEYHYPSEKGGENYYPDSYIKNGTLQQFLKEKEKETIADYDKGGVHANSNVVSHAAYLMYEDGAFSSREEMAKVWYNSLFLLSSYSNFEDCALAVIQSAKNLGLKDASIYKITKAFQDTKMLEGEEYELSGTISSNQKIKDAKIEIYSYKDNSFITSTTSDQEGNYKLNLSVGTYNIKVTKKDFSEFNKVIVIKGDTKLDIQLSSTIKKKSNACKSANCYNVTIYYMDGNDQNHLEENYETYPVEAGQTLDANVIVDAVNSTFGKPILSSDGKSFYMEMGGFQVEFGWYYRGTDEKFDWNKPITEDIEIEMKFFNGLFDNNTFMDINDLWK